MKLYDLPASPNARRVRIFIAEKGLGIPTQPVDMTKGENQRPEFLTKNSLGKMPVLELDNCTCITESAAICRYLEEIHPEPLLLGRDALERAQVEMWNRRMEIEILMPLMQVLFIPTICGKVLLHKSRNGERFAARIHWRNLNGWKARSPTETSSSTIPTLLPTSHFNVPLFWARLSGCVHPRIWLM